jgi:hypothetical protein
LRAEDTEAIAVFQKAEIEKWWTMMKATRVKPE